METAKSKSTPQEPQSLGGFNPRIVHERDPDTGRVVNINPYKLIVSKGERFFEWPKGSGNLWYENREPAGRMEQGLIIKGAEHKAWTPPETADQKLAREMASKDQQIEALQREINEIKREQKYSSSTDTKEKNHGSKQTRSNNKA